MVAKHQFCLCLAVGLVVPLLPARAEYITVQIRNTAPEDGILLAPVWIGFHDGSFDLFDMGQPVLAGGALERLAEDGNPEPLQVEFGSSVSGGIGCVLVGFEGFPDVPVFEPGEQASAAFDLDPVLNRFMSFGSMVIPSNDGFIANDDPMAIELFDAFGKFKGEQTILILGTAVYDAGTELNNEMDAAFLNQSAPDTGTTTSEAVRRHPGFIGSFTNAAPGEDPVILGAYIDPGIFIDPAAADFTRPGAVVAEITIIPEPATIVLLLGGGLALLRKRRGIR